MLPEVSLTGALITVVVTMFFLVLIAYAVTRQRICGK